LRQFAGAGFNALEQPHVLNRNHCLIGKRGEQFNLLVGEWSRVGASQSEHANRDALAHERNGKDRPEMTDFL